MVKNNSLPSQLGKNIMTELSYSDLSQNDRALLKKKIIEIQRDFQIELF